MNYLGWSGVLRGNGVRVDIYRVIRDVTRETMVKQVSSTAHYTSQCRIPTEKINGRQEREGGKQSAKSVRERTLRLTRLVLSMMSHWGGLCGRREVTLKRCKIVLLHRFMPEFSFQGFVVKAIAFVPRIWVV